MARLLHISDLHFERTASPAAVEAVHALAEEIAPDAVISSGDHVERGDYEGQFVAARAFLDRFAAPWLAVPGNHDLPVWNPLARLTRPFERFRRLIADDLAPALALPGCHVVGLCSPSRLTLDLGYLDAGLLDRAARALAAAPEGAARIAVVHHPLAAFVGAGPLRKHLRGHWTATRRLLEAGAHAVLCGHLHFPALAVLERGRGGPAAPGALLGRGRLLLVQGGTACSTRLRPRSGCAAHAVHVIDIESGRLRVGCRLLVGGAFREVAAPREFALAP